MEKSLKIAIASGKGGTGKTTIALSLAQSLCLSKKYAKKNIYLIDCDVEEPNAKLFLNESKKSYEKNRPITVPIPKINEEACTLCGLCTKFCQYNALARVGKVLVFPELCHSCGGCKLICPENAIEEIPHAIGSETKMNIEYKDNTLHFIEGRLQVGKALAPPIIKEIKKAAFKDAEKESIFILDSPPGASCPMTTTIDGVDFTILVTEPTAFGLHDLKIAVETLRQTKIPFGVLINRSDSGDNRVVQYCEAEEIPLLLEIKEDMEIAKAYSIGKTIIDTDENYLKEFQNLFLFIEEKVGE